MAKLFTLHTYAKVPTTHAFKAKSLDAALAQWRAKDKDYEETEPHAYELDGSGELVETRRYALQIRELHASDYEDVTVSNDVADLHWGFMQYCDPRYYQGFVRIYDRKEARLVARVKVIL